MTVIELINALLHLTPDKEVVYDDGFGDFFDNIASVHEETDVVYLEHDI